MLLLPDKSIMGSETSNTEHIANEFQLIEAERPDLLHSVRQAVINNREGWVRTYLNKTRLLEQASERILSVQ